MEAVPGGNFIFAVSNEVFFLSAKHNTICGDLSRLVPRGDYNSNSPKCLVTIAMMCQSLWHTYNEMSYE